MILPTFGESKNNEFMKLQKNYPLHYSFFFAFALILLGTGCVKDQCTRTTTYIQMNPVYMDYEEFRTSVASKAVRALENPGKIALRGNTLFINELEKGIHIIDITNAENPQNLAFIEILGNIDIAVKGNILYADSYMDVVALDISNPNNVVEVNRVEEVFPVDWNRGIVYDEQGIVVDWEEEEVTEEVDCDSNRSNGGVFWQTDMFDADFAVESSGAIPASIPNGGGQSETGVGGSFARFVISGDYLYAVDNTSLYPFSIANPSDPVSTASPISVGWNIETLFPYKNNLFIGSQNGMFIYSTEDPNNPAFVSEFAHVRSCDPVVVEGNYAYVTLRNGNPTCGGFENQLDIIDITNMSNPQLIRTYEMQEPHGLGIDDGTLFICDKGAGLKVYDVEDPQEIELIKQDRAVEVKDVIPFNNKLFAIGDNGFLLFDYSNLDDIKELSAIPVGGN